MGSGPAWCSERGCGLGSKCRAYQAGDLGVLARVDQEHARAGVRSAEVGVASAEDALLAGVGVTMTAFALAALAGALLPARAARLADPPLPQAEPQSEAA